MTEENNSKDNDSSYFNKKVALLTIGIGSSITVLFWLLFFHIISAPTFLKYTGLSDSVLLTQPNKIVDPFVLYSIGELVRDGTLMSLDELWSFQSTFYQTIISFLIGIIGIFGVLAFFFIKGSSNDKAREAAIEHSRTYISSADFENRINNEVNTRIIGVQKDYNDAMEELELAKNTILNQKEIIGILSRNQKDIQRHIKVIAKTISENDLDDEEGAELELIVERRSHGIHEA